MQMEEASFVYMDEFDAFYHYELSERVIRKNMLSQQLKDDNEETDLIEILKEYNLNDKEWQKELSN